MVSLLCLRKRPVGEGTYSKGGLICFQILPAFLTIKVPTQHMVDKIRCFIQTYLSTQVSNLFHYVGSPHMNRVGTHFSLKKLLFVYYYFLTHRQSQIVVGTEVK